MCQFRFPQTSRTKVPLEGVQVTQMGALSLFYDPGRFRGWALQGTGVLKNQKSPLRGTTTKGNRYLMVKTNAARYLRKSTEDDGKSVG